MTTEQAQTKYAPPSPDQWSSAELSARQDQVSALAQAANSMLSIHGSEHNLTTFPLWGGEMQEIQAFFQNQETGCLIAIGSYPIEGPDPVGVHVSIIQPSENPDNHFQYTQFTGTITSFTTTIAPSELNRSDVEHLGYFSLPSLETLTDLLENSEPIGIRKLEKQVYPALIKEKEQKDQPRLTTSDKTMENLVAQALYGEPGLKTQVAKLTLEEILAGRTST